MRQKIARIYVAYHQEAVIEAIEKQFPNAFVVKYPDELQVDEEFEDYMIGVRSL